MKQMRCSAGVIGEFNLSARFYGHALASDWSSSIMWPQYWPLIGPALKLSAALAILWLKENKNSPPQPQSVLGLGDGHFYYNCESAWKPNIKCPTHSSSQALSKPITACDQLGENYKIWILFSYHPEYANHAASSLS